MALLMSVHKLSSTAELVKRPWVLITGNRYKCLICPLLFNFAIDKVTEDSSEDFCDPNVELASDKNNVT